MIDSQPSKLSWLAQRRENTFERDNLRDIDLAFHAIFEYDMDAIIT